MLMALSLQPKNSNLLLAPLRFVMTKSSPKDHEETFAIDCFTSTET